MDLVQQIVVAATFVFSMTIGMMPMINKWLKKRKNVFNVSQAKPSPMSGLAVPIGNYFCGGLLVAFLFLRMLPFAYKKFNDLLANWNQQETHYFTPSSSTLSSFNSSFNSTSANKLQYHYQQTFPYVEMIICGSFFVAYFLRQLALTFADHEAVFLREADKKSGQVPFTPDEDQPASLVSLKKQSDDDQRMFSSELTMTNNNFHRANCPMSSSNGHLNLSSQLNGHRVIGRRELKIPTRLRSTDSPPTTDTSASSSGNGSPSDPFPSHQSSIIIVVPVGEFNEEHLQTCAAIRRGMTASAGPFLQQLFNGFILTSQQPSDNNLIKNPAPLILLSVFLAAMTLTAVELNKKLRELFVSDSAIIFLCHLTLSTGFPLGMILSSLLTGSIAGEMLQSSVAAGLLCYLVFMVLLNPANSGSSISVVRFRLLGYYLCVYTGFSVMLSLIMFIVPSVQD